jgi:hypothetical protein
MVSVLATGPKVRKLQMDFLRVITIRGTHSLGEVKPEAPRKILCT